MWVILESISIYCFFSWLYVMFLCGIILKPYPRYWWICRDAGSCHPFSDVCQALFWEAFNLLRLQILTAAGRAILFLLPLGPSPSHIPDGLAEALVLFWHRFWFSVSVVLSSVEVSLCPPSPSLSRILSFNPERLACWLWSVYPCGVGHGFRHLDM